MKKLSLLMVIGFCSSMAMAQSVRQSQQAPEISLPNVKDSTVNLSSFRGKVVLIDFWASWCPPCRQSIPGVVKLYNKYKSQGFEVVAVSIDSKKSSWVKAMKYFKMPYVSLLDDRGWGAKSIADYGIEGIPATFLLDKKGNVVAVDAEGMQLENAVKKLLGQ